MLAPVHKSVSVSDACAGAGPATALSRSQLFALQRAFYESAGLTAWSQGIVPSQVTTNPVIAGAYARVILGYLRDLAREDAIDFSQPLYVLDLGAGSGRLSYLVHKQLTALRVCTLWPRLKLHFVLCDLGDANLPAHERNPRLLPLLASGVLDCAALPPADLHSPPALRLLRSGTLLNRERLGNPLIVLANYFFDSIPHDAFRVTGGRLEECRVTLCEPVEALPAALQLKLSYRPLDPLAGDAGYYRERLWNQQLAAYAGRLPDTHFLFPVGPLRYLRWLTELAPQPLLLLAADKGYDYVEQIRSYQNLALTQHGGFSLPVNFHAIAELAGADGFTVLRGPRRESQLKILGLFRGLRDRGVETALAFAEQIGRTHPSDRHRVLKQAVMPAMEQPLGYLLSLLRLSQFDPWFVLTYKDALIQEAAHGPPALRPELAEDLGRVWENFFPASDPRDLRAAIAQILRSAGCLADAAAYDAAPCGTAPPEASGIKSDPA